MLAELKPFTSQQLQEVHARTLDLLDKTGIVIMHKPSLAMLAEHGAKVEGSLVRFPPKLVEDALSMVPSEFTLVGRNRARSVKIGNGSLVLAPTGGEVYVHDIERGRRTGRLEDLANFIKLAQGSRVVDVTDVSTVDPSELRGDEKTCLSMLEGIKNSDKPLEGLSVGKMQSEICIRMAEIATQATHEEQFIIAIANTFSPLSWDQNMLEAIWAYSGANQPVVITCCSLSGVTAPISLAGSIVQDNAEILAGVIIAQLIRPGAPVVYGNTSSIGDMKTLGLATGAPECALLATASCQLARFYRLPFRGGGGLTDAKEVDVQAGIESTMNLFCTFANKVDYVLHGLGMLDGFNTVSYEKWIVDEEICGMARRFFRGIDQFSGEMMTAIQDVGPGGNFLEHSSTLLNFRTAFYTPVISNRDNWDNWCQSKVSIPEKAKETWEKRLAEFEAPLLPPEVYKELLSFVGKQASN
jgi:trimethylamine--corrinoid protein Co-methyltransferase